MLESLWYFARHLGDIITVVDGEGAVANESECRTETLNGRAYVKWSKVGR